MKKVFLILVAILLAFSGFAQKYTENDAKQFYRTIQGDYTVIVNPPFLHDRRKNCTIFVLKRMLNL